MMKWFTYVPLLRLFDSSSVIATMRDNQWPILHWDGKPISDINDVSPGDVLAIGYVMPLGVWKEFEIVEITEQPPFMAVIKLK